MGVKAGERILCPITPYKGMEGEAVAGSNNERYPAFGEAVQAAKAHLLALLPEGDRQTKRTDHTGGVYPFTFEDAAAAVCGDPQYVFLVKTALEAFRARVNEFWSLVYTDGTVEYVYRTWAGKNIRLAREVGREEAESELVFQLRKTIINFDPKVGTPFRYFAVTCALMNLTAWAEQQNSAVRVPEKEMRKHHGRSHMMKTSLDRPLSSNPSGNQDEDDTATIAEGVPLAVAAEQEQFLIKKQEGSL